MTGERLGQAQFQAHVELLRSFLAHRDEIVERIQGLLNAQRKPIEYLQDRPLLSRLFADCFFAGAALTPDQSRLRGRLEEAHWAGGFRPRVIPGLHNDLVDPAEMAMRAFHLWQRTRWPGRNGRVRYAETLFDLYVIRNLELLSLRLWDGDAGGARARLSRIQVVLDGLWRGAPADRPVLLRDARWLIPLAQSPTTDELGAYFEVAERVAETLPDEDRIEIQKAGVRMIGGHLRSQIRHYSMKDGVSLDDESLVLRTRNSNALDFALLVQGLAPLLEAYEHALRGGDAPGRLELASAICQGLSPDPELFVERLDLLAAYSMIEHLFVSVDGEQQVAYTPAGRRHLRLLREYRARIGRLSEPLHEDCARLRPVEGACSPYGVLYGTPSNLTEHMALKALQPDAVTRFVLEDVFADGDAGGEKLAWVSGWRKLPHVDPEVQRLFDYPQRFAEQVFERIEQALCRGAAAGEASAAVRTGRLFVLSGEDPGGDAEASSIADLPARYLASTDPRSVAAGGAAAYEESRLLRDRQEGMFLLSYATPGGWIAVSKDVLTEVLGAGRDAKIVGLPAAAARVLKSMCPELVVLPERAQASTPPSMVKA